MNKMQQPSKNSDGHTSASKSSREDKVLVKKAIGGSEEAHKVIVNKYQKPLYFHISKMVKDQNSVEDLVQETFVKAFNHLQRYQSGYAFSTWLYRIATNHTIDYLRKKKLKTLSIDRPIKPDEPDTKMQLPDESFSTDKKIIRSERKKIVQEAIENLPEKYRQVIQLRHMKEMSYQEIVDVLDRPLGTVKAHLFRAREMLYKALKDHEYGFRK